MKLGNFTEQSILEYRQKAEGQLCQRPDGSIYGIPTNRECVLGKPITKKKEKEKDKTGVKAEKKVPKDNKGLIRNAIDRIKNSQAHMDQLVGTIQRNLAERATERLLSPETILQVAEESFSESFNKIDRAIQDLGNPGDLEARIFAYEVARLEFDGNPEAEEQIKQKIEELQNSLNDLNSTIQGEFSNILNTLIQRGDASLARENANNVLIDLPKDHPFSESDYREQLVTLYALSNNSVNTLQEVFYDGERAFAMPPSSTEENGEVLDFPGTIDVGLSGEWQSQNSIFWHEFGHHIDFSNQEVATAMQMWIMSRATSETPVSLNDLANSTSYDASEMAIPGNFIDPYIGRVMGEEGLRTTEALSMGLQYFTDPASMSRLYREDPEYFKLIVGILSAL